jgi:hypothetical protein
MMVKTVSESDFIREFKDARPDDFSNDALSGIYNYLSDLSEDIGEAMELDVIAICCDFTEYNSLEEVIENYSDLSDIECVDDLRYYTTVIEISCDGLVIQDF